MPRGSLFFSENTSPKARARLLHELLCLMDRDEMRHALIEVWKRTGDKDRVAFMAGNRDFMATLFSEEERAALEAGAHFAMITARRTPH